MSSLVIVESPTKAKTIKKYLGQGFEVMASNGHVRDLTKRNGVDPEQDFSMHYELVERNKSNVEAIARAAKKADSLYLATDPDREGEAISWHLFEVLRNKGVLDEKRVRRVVFYEITENAIKDAIANPRDLSHELVNAQQARRALDYLVGFNLSPLLWRKVGGPNLSAGRVQSPALRMIVEREEERERFEPKEYWTIDADSQKEEQGFSARLTHLRGDKLEQFSITEEPAASEARTTLLARAQGSLTVRTVEKKQRRRNPAAPFTTSTLQQEAVRKLGFGARRTMRIAQELYEGIDIGQGAVGLITYMRTDSVHLSSDAVNDARNLISTRYGKSKVPAKPRVFKTKSKNAQEAHEAIRPTQAAIIPEQIKGSLSGDQFKLYDLIWKRTIASQMIHATLDTVSVDLVTDDEGTGVFRTTGSTVRNAGFMEVYQEGLDDAAKGDSENRALPPLNEGDAVPLLDIRAEQHFTEPPPRYTEASLVKALEDYGIGRPSTYATIISTLQDREYVDKDQGRFLPTEMGKMVNRFLTEHFKTYVDYDFTARLEDELDSISRGEETWIPVMRNFWEPFKDRVAEKRNLSRVERELGTDPESGKPVSVRIGRYGPFAQIGTKEDEEKPKFASLRPGQKIDEITLEEALELFKAKADLPRELGETDDGESITTGISRFGPFVKYGKRYVSLSEDDPRTITLERAKAIVAEDKAAEAKKYIKTFDDSEIKILNGRYGPYITDGKKNVKIPKDRAPESLTLQECAELIAQAPEKKPRKRKPPAKKGASAR